MAAYDLVLRGNELLHRHNRGDDLNARELFQRAVEIDPDYVLAHVRLAQTYLNEFFWDDSGASLGRAFEIARQAIEIDDMAAVCLSWRRTSRSDASNDWSLIRARPTSSAG
jgi:adenylate cyclase